MLELITRSSLVLATTLVLASCGASSDVSIKGAAAMPDENPLVLYDEPAIRLVTLPAAAADADAFWQEMADVAAEQAQGATYSLSRRPVQRILRIVRTEFGNAIAFNFSILEERQAGGDRVIRLQPLIAWRAEAGAGNRTVPMAAADARQRLADSRPALQQLAVQAVQRLNP